MKSIKNLKLNEMEKILRKVSCKDRLPEKEEWYFTPDGECFYDKSANEWQHGRSSLILSNVEYWYEEVNSEEYFKNSPLWMKAFEAGREDVLTDVELHKQMCEADSKERYEKALDLLISTIKPLPEAALLRHKETLVKNGFWKEDNIIEALKIAAGLEE